MKKTDLNERTANNEEREYYVIVNGEKVPVTYEVYLEYYRPERREAQRKYRNSKQPMINGKRCKGDCKYCTAYDGIGCTQSREVSLDQMTEDGTFEAVAPDNTESEAIAHVLKEEMREALQEENDLCRETFELMNQQMTQKEMATELGVSSPGTVSYYTKRIREKLDGFND